MIVTFAPSRRHTEPSSTPITPPPMTMSFSGHGGERERAGVGEDAIFVEGKEGERDGYGARRNDDGLRLVGRYTCFRGAPPAPRPRSPP